LLSARRDSPSKDGWNVSAHGRGEAGPAVLDRLRDEIRRIERRPSRREGVLACGRPEIDGALPGGGFRRGGLTELAGGPASGKTAAALALLGALPPGELAAWVDGRGELYPPAAAALGVDLARLLVVRPGARRPDVRRAERAGSRGEDPALAGIWAGEALLASGAFGVVTIDVPLDAARLRGAETIARRLQAAVEKGGAIGVWLAEPGSALRLPAAARLVLGGRPAPLRRGGGHAA
jgi:protein ImuA